LSGGRAGAAKRRSGREGKRPYAPRMPPEQRREQVLDSTLKLIAERGYESVSMEGIARAAGVTKPVVYDLFGTLSDLLEDLLEREEQRALAQLAELTPQPNPDADPAEVLIDGVTAFVRAVGARPDSWRLSLMPPEAMPGVVREHVERERTRIAEQMEQVVRWGVDQLEVPIEDIELLVETIMTLVNEGARMHLADPERYPVDRIAAFVASLLASVRR
jgi:AcrR family transcriptional regulator